MKKSIGCENDETSLSELMHPLKAPVVAKVCVPGSKSYTNRALILGALTKTPVCLKNVLFSDDTEAMIECLETLGVEIETDGQQLVVRGDISSIEDKNYQLYARDSGTTLRFILSLLCIVPGIKTIQGNARLSERPIKDLVDALRQLGAKIEYCEEEGKLPLKVLSATLSEKVVYLEGSLSSQFCSSLLLIAPFLSQGLTIYLKGEPVSRPYIDMTVDFMREWGVDVKQENGSYFVSAFQQYSKRECVIEGDFSSAGYFFAIAALTKSMVTVENVNPLSLQADRRFLSILESMGNGVSYGKNSVSVYGKQVVALTVDMEDCPDQVMTMAVLAAFASGVTKITGVRSLRYKETERVVAIRCELSKMGIRTEETFDTLVIYGGSPRGAEIDTYNDHRMAMAFACAGMCLEGVVIRCPEVVKKTFPCFWEVLGRLQ